MGTRITWRFCVRVLNSGTHLFYSRGFEEGCDRPKYVRITLCGVIKSRGIDQNNATAVEIKRFCHLYGVCTRS